MINRQKYNLAVLSKLQEFLQKHPDFRFIQALWALDIVDRDENNTIIDRFYEEPNKTLEKVSKALKEFPEIEEKERKTQENLVKMMKELPLRKK